MCSLIRLFVLLRSIRPERNVAVSGQVCKMTKNREKITPQPAAFEDRNPSFILLVMERKGRKLPICVSLEWTIIGLWICGTQPPELTMARQLPTSAKYAEPGLNLHKFYN